MSLFKHDTTNTPPPSIPTRIIWRDTDGERRNSAITGYLNYDGSNMPKGQYIQADGRRYVLATKVIKWVVA